MELLTDILAIAGWSFFGAILYSIIYMLRRHADDKWHSGTGFVSALSFGLIAASLVLG